MTRRTLLIVLILLLAFSPSSFALVRRSDTARFTSGVTRILLAPLQIPVQALSGTAYGPPIVGTVGGLLTGTLRTMTDLIGGAFDVFGASAPYAKYALFAL